MRAFGRVALVLGTLAVGLALAYFPEAAPEHTGMGGTGGAEQVLLLTANGYGAYGNYFRDLMEMHGWELTTAGVTPTVSPCYWGETLEVDTLVSGITEVSRYDCLLIMPNRAVDGDSHQQLLDSPEALAMVSEAVQESVLVVAVCGGVRVLAAADVIDGVRVTGHSLYVGEYTAAGAIWQGSSVPPVLDGNILTSTQSHYFGHEIFWTMRAAIDSLRALKAGA
jgi:putative intracellular protease/amidase